MKTLTVRTELVRQAGRRRTRLTLALLVALPLLLLGALQIGDGSSRSADQFDQLLRLATASGLNFGLFTLFVASGFLLVVVVALFCGDTVASEAGWGSLRYLLAAPVTRARLLTSKLVAALVYSVVATAVLLATALVAGTVRYGWHSLLLPAGGALPAGTGVVRVLAVAAYILVSLLSVAGLAFLLSVSTDAPLGAVGGAVLVVILSNILDQLSALGSLRVVLPTHYSTAFIALLSDTVQTDSMVKGAFVSIAESAVLLALAWWRFVRKDITS